MRAGIGFDVHAFAEGRELVLGGVTIPGGPGLAGHSDADVVCHAIADALLGAAAFGDLGSHFPDTDERWKDASSIELLRLVARKVYAAKFTISSVDATVLIEEPKLAPFRVRMRECIAQAVGIGRERVSVKATTTEGLGTVGRGEGAACMAVVLLDE
jgi:2-C-methyl-D-erythritol 2,4-cyclodiphosphate synthase